ncbi:hypothetical protein D3Z36_05160 [Lachnospiraceae bacterium]|nr:hypothetical protein [Lachnospiraceae bacterium]
MQWLITTIFQFDRLFFTYDRITGWMAAAKVLYLFLLVFCWCFVFLLNAKNILKEIEEYV